MAPCRRPEGDPAPVYGEHSSYFTLEIHHAGFFVGNGSERSYLDGHIIFYDDVESLTWSPVILEKIVEEIGYEMAGRIRVFYSNPLATMKTDLREIRDEFDTRRMISLVDLGQHNFKIYLDHDQSLDAVNMDDVVHYPVAQLAPVISPSKSRSSRQSEMPVVQDEQAPLPIQVVYPDAADGRTRQSKRNRSSRAVLSEESEEDDQSEAESDSEEEEDSDFEIVDSDNAVSDGDDDLYADTVEDSDDEKVKKGKSAIQKGKQKCEIKEEVSDGEDLWGPDSADETDCMRFKTFREADLQNPIFSVGLVFADVELLRKAIRSYSCIHRKPIKLPINDKARVRAVCEKKCPWYIWASTDTKTKAWQIKKYTSQHTCSGGKWKVCAFTANFIAEKYLDSFRADQGMNLTNFSRVVQKGWKMTPTRSKLQRAKRIAMTVIYGDEEEQYKILWDYANEIRTSNPGSSFFLSLDDAGGFKQCYMSLEACKRGFLEGCRPIIFIDGCHIKTRYRGQLLTAVGIDPNDCIFPIAMAAVEVEDTASWTWFLETLKSDLGIMNTTPWTIMSDKQKGLINDVRVVFPDSEHRFCVRHMWQNFQQLFKGDVLKNQLWKIARSNTVVLFEKHMEEMKLLNSNAHAWLDNLDPKTWVRAFQTDLCKCDILLNNNCEVFNKYILEARELPVLSMLETIKSQIMGRHYSKNTERSKWSGPVCPKIKKKVEKHIELSNTIFAKPAGDGLFAVGELVSSQPVDYVVDLQKKYCSCMRWQKTGIPCPHAISCLRHDETDPYTVVDQCYSLEMHDKAYGNIVYPCKDRTEWTKQHGPVIQPPLYKKHVGRPTKSRRKAPYEVNAKGGDKKMTRHGVSQCFR